MSELIGVERTKLAYRIKLLGIVPCAKKRKAFLYNDYQIELIEENDFRNYEGYEEIYPSKINHILQKAIWSENNYKRKMNKNAFN